MDWSKAKNILIIAFIVINILMGYTLFFKDKQVDTTNSPDFIEQATALLNNKNITIATKIPNTNPQLSALTVFYENISPELLNTSFFNDNGTMTAKGEGLIELNHDEEGITIVNKKLIIYESNATETKYSSLKQEEVIDIALEFLKDKGYGIDDIKLSFIKNVGDYYYIEFSKVYNDIYLESAFTNIQMDSRGVVKMERMWLDVKETGLEENAISISTASKAILGLLSMKEVYGKKVTEISLCYYFNPGKHEYIEDPLEAKQGRGIPAWRIQFEDGYKVFMDDY